MYSMKLTESELRCLRLIARNSKASISEIATALSALSRNIDSLDVIREVKRSRQLWNPDKVRLVLSRRVPCTHWSEGLLLITGVSLSSSK